MPGRDKIVRPVEVQTTDKSGKTIYMKCPIQHLVPINVQDLEDTVQTESVINRDEPLKIRMVRDEDVTVIQGQ